MPRGLSESSPSSRPAPRKQIRHNRISSADWLSLLSTSVNSPDHLATARHVASRRQSFSASRRISLLNHLLRDRRRESSTRCPSNLTRSKSKHVHRILIQARSTLVATLTIIRKIRATVRTEYFLEKDSAQTLIEPIKGY